MPTETRTCRLLVGLTLAVVATCLIHAPAAAQDAGLDYPSAKCTHKVFGCCWDSFPVTCDETAISRRKPRGAVEHASATGFELDSSGEESPTTRLPAEPLVHIALPSGTEVDFIELDPAPNADPGDPPPLFVVERTAPGVRAFTPVALEYLNPRELLHVLDARQAAPLALRRRYGLRGGAAGGALRDSGWKAPVTEFCDPGGAEPAAVAAQVAGHDELFFSDYDGPSTTPNHWHVLLPGSPNDVYRLLGSANSVTDFSASIGFCNRDDISSFPTPGYPRVAWMRSRPAGGTWGYSDVNMLFYAPGETLFGTLDSVSEEYGLMYDFRVIIDYAKPGDTFHIGAGWDPWYPAG